MTQVTSQDLEIIKGLINKNTDLIDRKTELILEKMETVSSKIDTLDKRIERLENGNDKISTAVIIALLLGLVKWLFFNTPLS